MSSPSPAPKSPEQSDKSKKYDRQLRLWGDHGQQLLETAKICVINANALGTEILKNLILPGAGTFTIIDGEKVSEEDIGNNFFLETESVGTSRAQAATQCLLELNPDVRGDYIDESLEHVLSNSQDFFNNFSIVIACAVPDKTLIPLSQLLWAAKVPLMACRTIGFLGYIRLQLNEHTIVEAHPDVLSPDLRLDRPWPALKAHLSATDISKLDRIERSHVPPITILYYYLNKFQEAHDGALPKSRSDKEEIKEAIRDSVIPDEDGVGILEENFVEAMSFINTCTMSGNIPANVQAILDDDACTNLTHKSTPFWVICAAIRELVEVEGALPVRGALPDMTADTESYVKLQQIYQKQAHMQAESVYRRAAQIARNLGLHEDIITEAQVRLFCKRSHELHVIRGSCIADEYEKTSLDLSSYLEDPDSLMFSYVTLRGLERFISEFNTYPGQLDDQVEPDVVKIKTIIQKMLADWGCTQVVRDERVHEICRYGGAELHSVSAMIGGCAAQEIIKVISHQYKPLCNTYIYDAITTNSATFCF